MKQTGGRVRTTGGVFLLLGLLATVFVGCSDDGNQGAATQELVGSWQPGEGELFRFFPGAEFLVMQLREDGTGEFVFREPESGALGCLDFIYAPFGDGAVFIDMEIFDEASAFSPKSFAFAVDGEAMTLMDNVGRSQTFIKLDVLPAGAECQAFSEVLSSNELEADPHTETGLVWDGSSLWFGADAQPNDQLLQYDPVLGTLGAPIDLPSNVAGVQAYDGSFLWFHTGAGYIVSRRDFADVQIDSIDTDLDLGHRLSIGAMAWDGTHLWLSGESSTAGERELLQVDATTKTLINSYPFALDLAALTWDGTYFWGIVFGSPSPVVRIDPDTRQVLGTYEIPGYGQLFQRYRGIAAADDVLYLLVENGPRDPSTVTILQVTP